MPSSGVELASLIQILGKIEYGNKCEVWKGLVVTPRGREVAAFIKYLPPRAIFIECIAAVIGRSLGLSIPRPLLIRANPAQLPLLELTEVTILFGSEDSRYPSLQQLVTLDTVMQKLRDWPDILKAGCFDEWIANSDRHKGNILYDGKNSFTLIDHSHAIPEQHKFNKPIHRNSMLQLAKPEKSDEIGLKRALKKSNNEIQSMLEILKEDWSTLTQSEIYCSKEKSDQIINFLSKRLDLLEQLISQQLGYKQQHLNFHETG